MGDETIEANQSPEERSEEQVVDGTAQVAEATGAEMDGVGLEEGVAATESPAPEQSSPDVAPDATELQGEQAAKSAEESPLAEPESAAYQETVDEEVTENDKLMAFLCYVIGFLVPGIVLLSVDMRERRYQRVHATHSLALWSVSIVFYAALALADMILVQIACVGWLLACVSIPLYLLPPILIFYYALLASQGREFDIPYLSDALRQQGWI